MYLAYEIFMHLFIYLFITILCRLRRRGDSEWFSKPSWRFIFSSAGLRRSSCITAALSDRVHYGQSIRLPTSTASPPYSKSRDFLKLPMRQCGGLICSTKSTNAVKNPPGWRENLSLCFIIIKQKSFSSINPRFTIKIWAKVFNLGTIKVLIQ